MGIVADLIQEGIRIGFENTIIHKGWIILFFSTIIYILIFYGKYSHFEKALTFLVIIMGLSFIIVFFMVKPSLTSIAQGLLPSIPDVPGALGLIAAITGTTCSAAVFIVRSTVVAEKGWTVNDLKKEKRFFCFCIYDAFFKWNNNGCFSRYASPFWIES